MNIFILDTNPAIAASYHCDQHLHKMILESAQMLSTAARTWFPNIRSSIIYKPAYPNHPCTKWVTQSFNNAHWLINLCTALEDIRESLNCPRHSSMDVIDAVADYIPTQPGLPESFVFAGPPNISIRPSLSITEKYQLYYRKKHMEWLDSGRGMGYKNRPIPAFIADLIYQ
jgi:hypothetical protein